MSLLSCHREVTASLEFEFSNCSQIVGRFSILLFFCFWFLFAIFSLNCFIAGAFFSFCLFIGSCARSTSAYGGKLLLLVSFLFVRSLVVDSSLVVGGSTIFVCFLLSASFEQHGWSSLLYPMSLFDRTDGLLLPAGRNVIV